MIVPGPHIMSLSDHANESSLVPYTCPRSIHKQKINKILSNRFHRSVSPAQQSPSPYSKKNHICVTIVTRTALNVQVESATDINSFLKGFVAYSTCTFNNC